MFPNEWSHVLTASVTPVVIISACALLCLAFYNRLAAIISRLRAVQRERLEFQERLESITPSEIQRNRAMRDETILENLAEQTVRIRRRAKMIRATLLCLLSAILALVLSSLLNGLTIVWPSATFAAAGMFVTGMLLLFSGITAALIEMIIALEPVQLETEVIAELTGANH